MMYPLRYAFLLLAASAAVSSGGHAGKDANVPPRAHELDKSYTFERYLAHFKKSYDDPDDYARRSRIFARNLNTILHHNGEKRMTEDGEIVGGGYVMGVNAFTDVDIEELPTGYNKLVHTAWSSQLVGDGALKMERLLGGVQSYSVSDFLCSASSTFHYLVMGAGVCYVSFVHMYYCRTHQ
jgi:hypothetical protein